MIRFNSPGSVFINNYIRERMWWQVKQIWMKVLNIKACAEILEPDSSPCLYKPHSLVL